MSSTVFKIILVDDHILLRDALAKFIFDFKNCTVLSLAADGNELIEQINNGAEPDIILLDLNMPNMDGYEVAKWLKANKPHIKILILTMYDSDVALLRLLQTGVRGFMKKDIHPNRLHEAIISVGNDGYYYCNSSTGKLADFFRVDKFGAAAYEKAQFTDFEIQFLRKCATELTFKEIAAELNITARVIDACREKLFLKLDVKNRVGLALYAVKCGIVTF